MQVENALPSVGAKTAHGINVDMAIPAVRRENAVAMLRGFSQQDTGERLPIDVVRSLASGKLEECWQEVHPTHDRIGVLLRLHHAWPRDNQRHQDAGVIKIPFRKWPLRAVIAAEQK